MSDESERPGQAYWGLVEPIWKAISIYDGPAKFISQFRAVPLPAGLLYAAHWCQSEVRNGGFHQFFYNSTGVLAPEALTAFESIGLHEWATILTEAMRLFGTPYPRERVDRIQKLAAVPREREKRAFQDLDLKFYDWLHAEKHRFEHAADKFAQEHESES